MAFSDDLGYVVSLIHLELKTKLETQGHGKRGNSDLINNIHQEIKEQANKIISETYMMYYWEFVEKGVSASNIPYTPNSGRKNSKYIEGLIKFWRKKGLGVKEAKKASFATAKKHKKEGMPTAGSFGFSNDGTRLNFLRDTLDEQEARIFQLLEDRIGQSSLILLDKVLDNVSSNTV